MKDILSLKGKKSFSWWTVFGIRVSLIGLFHAHFISSIILLGSSALTTTAQLPLASMAIWYFCFCISEIILTGITFGHIGLLIEKIKA
jgi:sorbitol-specific phosphotransferase system component IIC